MAKFATTNRPTIVRSPVQTTDGRAPTHEGGLGYERDAKSELFLLAVTNMVGEQTFYEAGADRDDRFARLIRQAATEDADWLVRFIPWLRDTANMRSAPVVAAAEYVAAGAPNGRQAVDGALKRADEPGELLAYWLSTRGHPIPKPVKRGVADAVRRLYTERNLMRYDGTNRAWHFADVIELVHPRPKDLTQSALFRWALDRRREWGQPDERLEMVYADLSLSALAEDSRREVLRKRPDMLAEAGYSWEKLSAWLPGGMDAEAWEAIIPTMGYMALLRNLRNFDEAKVADEVKDSIAAKLADPDEVRRSRQFPYRFYSAWKAAKSLTWGPALERAVRASLDNLPTFGGRTLILIDVSGSMVMSMSGRSVAQRWELAALFGLALAHRCESADVVAFDNNGYRVNVGPADSILRQVDEIGKAGGGGTNTFGVMTAAYSGHDRIVILTDEQSYGSPPAHLLSTPCYTFNLAGYRYGAAPSGQGQWHTFGGLNDAGFTVIDTLEKRRNGAWPF